MATGTHFQQMEHNFLVSNQTILRVVHKTCIAIWEALHDKYIYLPKTVEEWKNNAAVFEELCQVSHALGDDYEYYT